MITNKIAIVIPTIRKEMHAKFILEWYHLIVKHNVELVTVWDGENPIVEHNGKTFTLEEIMGDNADLISKKCAASRNLGFAYVAKYMPNIEYIYTLDDDCHPIGDPIEDHINQLKRSVPISWISTADIPMRGFPYQIREEAPCMLSHGVWETTPDYDAPTQLLTPKDFKPTYYKGVIPKGIYAPICGMNLAFRVEALKHIYFAPVGDFKGAERWDDILMGIMVIKKFAELGWGIVTGYSRINHIRASNVFFNLEKEAVGLRHGEEFWKDPENYVGDMWFDEFRKKTERWNEFITNL
jgi:hypothetical protein